MKLLETVARYVLTWPEGALFIDQAADGDLIVNYDLTDDEYKYIGVQEKADDWQTAKVTRAQWEAERARIAAMDGISEFSQEQANAEAEHEHRTQYEQELWDKVALDAQAMIFDAAGQEEPLVDIARRVGIWADAFMAERAKRLKGVK